MIIQFIRFALVGLLGTAAHYVVLYLLVEYQGSSPVVASGWGAVLGMVVNYILNFKLTFRSNQSHVQTFPKFALIAGLGFCLNLQLMAILTPHFYYLCSQILTTLVVLCWNFIVNTLWTFKTENALLHPKSDYLSMIQKWCTPAKLLLAILAIRIITLGIYPLYDPSESRYAEMGRKMLETGNWITPMIDYGIPFWGKPPLTLWLTAMSLGFGWINAFFARLPSLLLGIGMVGIVFQLAKTQRNQASAYFSVLILASTTAFFVLAGTVAMDQCLTFGTTLALASFWLALREKQALWGYVFFIGLSIGILAKGPIALVLTGITIGLWTLLTGRWLDIWQRIPWITGAALMLCISVPWFLIAEQKTPGFLEYFILGEHWKRFTESAWKGDLYGVGHAQAKGTIWVYWLIGGLPWSLVLLKHIIHSFAQKQNLALPPSQTDRDWLLYCLLWMLAPLLFFSFSANIIWTYILPGIPGLALLLGSRLSWDINRPSLYGPILFLLIPFVFIGVVIWYHLTNADFFKTQQKLVNTYQQNAVKGEYLIYYKDLPYSALFYLQGRVISIPRYRCLSLLKESLRFPAHHFYVFHQDDYAIMPMAITMRLVKVKQYGKFILLQAAPAA